MIGVLMTPDDEKRRKRCWAILMRTTLFATMTTTPMVIDVVVITGIAMTVTTVLILIMTMTDGFYHTKSVVGDVCDNNLGLI